ncbi:MAG: Spo0B domain-containing protein [Clostridium sp.]|nr:Spo0B domain-containing protein [Clostridium sp.]
MSADEQSSRMEGRLYMSFIALAAVILFCCLGITLAMDISRERRELDQRITETAAYIAEMDSVKEMLETGYPDDATIRNLDILVDTLGNVGGVLVCNQNGLRFYQTARQIAGDTYVDGDEAAILSGSEPYITTVYGTRGMQHCAFHGIRNDADKVVGFAMVSVPAATISQRQRNIVAVFICLFALMLVFSAVLAGAFLRFQKNALMGYRPGELLQLYIRQDEVINSLSEGLISAEKSGRILFANSEARRLMSENDEMLAGRMLPEVYPETAMEKVMATGKTVTSETVGTGDRTVLVTEVPIRTRGRAEGVLVLLQDRTEALRMSDELSGAKTMMDTLRAFNHEFLNKLHIILGYLQTGEIDRAKEFIMNSNLVSSQAVRDAANVLRVSEVCALVIGKMMHAAELGIRLTLLPDSTMLERDLVLRPDQYVTIIGNLLENAIEELSSGECEIREINLGIYCRSGVNIITCEDTGRGIPEELLPRIFEMGVTSKGENHGTGLFLVKSLLDSCGGEISVETEPGVGTIFTVTVTEKENSDVSGSDH